MERDDITVSKSIRGIAVYNMDIDQWIVANVYINAFDIDGCVRPRTFVNDKRDVFINRSE